MNSFLADLFILLVGFSTLGLMLWALPEQATAVSVPAVVGLVYLLTPTGPAPSPLSDYVVADAEKPVSTWTDSKGTQYSTRAAVLFVAKKAK